MSKATKIRTTGVITDKYYLTGGNVRYTVEIKVGDDTLKLESIPYSSKTKTLPIGKEVTVDFCESSKGYQYVEIIDENIIACKDDLKGEMTFLACFGIAVLFVIIYYAIK